VLRRHEDSDAGRSLREYYDRRLRAWRRSLRGPYLVALIIAGAFAYPLWRFAPHGEFYAGLVVGVFWGMLVWMRDEPPEFIAKWKRGADGEMKTGRVLKRLESAGWSAFHDRTTGRGNLDHIAVGPGGVLLLESKNLNGGISIGDDGLTTVFGDAEIDSFTNRRLAGAMTRSAIELRERITAATGLSYWVDAVVVIWGDFPDGLDERGGVTYVAGDQLATWLTSRPDRIPPRDVSHIRLALAADAVVPRAPSLTPDSV
jgi:hypothetical protein